MEDEKSSSKATKEKSLLSLEQNYLNNFFFLKSDFPKPVILFSKSFREILFFLSSNRKNEKLIKKNGTTPQLPCASWTLIQTNYEAMLKVH